MFTLAIALRLPSLPATGGSSGGGGPPPSGDELTTSLGTFTYTGPIGRHVLDSDGVWQPLIQNMPGFRGARAVVNWAADSDNAASWALLNDVNGAQSVVTDAGRSALQNVNAGATAYAPYLWGVSGHWGGAPAGPIHGAIQPGVAYAARIDVRSVSGATAGAIYHRNRDANFSPTESGNGTFTASGAFETFTSTFVQASAYLAFGQRITPSPSGPSAYNLSYPMLEDVTGRKGALIPSEYVPGGNGAPGWAWFGTERGTSRTNPTLPASWAAIAGQKDPSNASGVVGKVTDSTGAALSTLAGWYSEPTAVNLCQGHTTPGTRIGWAKTSGVCTGYIGRAGVLSADVTAIVEAPSGMVVAASDITLMAVINVISSSTTNFVTAGFNTTDTYWVWTSAATYGPLKFSSISANAMTSSVALSSFSAGTTVRIMRCPANGDQIRLELNNGTWHSTTVSGPVTLPTNTGTWDIKAPVLVPLAASPAASGSYAGSDNGRVVYYWGSPADFGFSFVGTGTGTFDVAYDRQALVDAGAGYLSPTGLVYAIRGGASGAVTQFDFGANGNGVTGRDTKVSVFARRFSGSSGPYFLLKSHAGAVATTSAAYGRLVSAPGSSVNTDSRVSFFAQANTTLYFVCPQVEQAAAGQTAVVTSPLTCAGSATTRTIAAVLSRAWGSAENASIARELTWTPAAGALAQKQVLWALYEDASNYLELSIAGTTVSWTKRIAGTNYTATASFTPVSGTPALFEFAIGAGGVTLSVDGIPGTPHANTSAGTAIDAGSIESVGGVNGGSVAIGSFKNLVVA